MIRKNIFGVSAIVLLVLGPACIQSIYSEEAAAYAGKEKPEFDSCDWRKNSQPD